MISTAICIGCGCDNDHACVDSVGTPCHWLRVDRAKGLGVCSHCGELLPTFPSANSSSLITPLMSRQCHIKQDSVTSNTSMGDRAHE